VTGWIARRGWRALSAIAAIAAIAITVIVFAVPGRSPSGAFPRSAPCGRTRQLAARQAAQRDCRAVLPACAAADRW
jgi:hypothetical protein